jgi:hypothetical protein
MVSVGKNVGRTIIMECASSSSSYPKEKWTRITLNTIQPAFMPPESQCP